MRNQIQTFDKSEKKALKSGFAKSASICVFGSCREAKKGTKEDVRTRRPPGPIVFNFRAFEYVNRRLRTS